MVLRPKRSTLQSFKMFTCYMLVKYRFEKQKKVNAVSLISIFAYVKFIPWDIASHKKAQIQFNRYQIWDNRCCNYFMSNHSIIIAPEAYLAFHVLLRKLLWIYWVILFLTIYFFEANYYAMMNYLVWCITRISNK